MAIAVVAFTEVKADAWPVAADPTAVAVPIAPPATTIANLLGDGRCRRGLDPFQAGGRRGKRRRREYTEGEQYCAERESFQH